MARQTPGATRRAGARRRGEVPRAASASARHRRARDAHRYLAGGRPVAVAHVPRLGARSVAGTRGCDPQLAAAAELVLAPPRAAPARLPARCDAPGDEALELMGCEHGEPVSDLRVERLGHTTAGPASRKQLAERLLAFAQRQDAVVVQDGMPGEGVMERRELGERGCSVVAWSRAGASKPRPAARTADGRVEAQARRHRRQARPAAGAPRGTPPWFDAPRANADNPAVARGRVRRMPFRGSGSAWDASRGPSRPPTHRVSLCC